MDKSWEFRKQDDVLQMLLLQMGVMALLGKKPKEDTRLSISRITNGTLNLCSLALIDEDLPNLICGDLSQVTTLVLKGNSFTGEGFITITNNPTLKLLKINLGSNGLVDESLFYLKDAQWELKELFLNKNNITGYGLQYLADLPKHSLEVLNLNENYITDHGVKQLTRWKCPNLHSLLFFGNCLKDQGVILLANCHTPQLTNFYIADNYHTAEGLFKIILRAKWVRIKQLQLHSQLIPEWQRDFLARQLQRKWPQSNVYL